MTDKEIKKLIENIHADFRRRLNADKWAQHIIREGKAAGMNDVALLAKQLGYHLSASVEWFTKDAELPFGDEQMEQIARDILQPLLKDNYDLINKAFDDAQRRLDEARGINMEPLHAKFPQERADSIYSSAADPLAKVETIRRRLKGPAETLTNAMSDRNMKKNAVERNKAGFETYITRTDDGNCCPWCAKNAGRYEYPDKTPRDVFRRHDNCGCKVVYECGNMRQDVHSKQTWEQPTGTEQELTRNPNVAQKPLGRNPDVKQKDLRIMGNKKALTEKVKGGILEGGYNEQDIIRAISQEGTNFVTKDINNPESLFGELVELVKPNAKYYDIKAHGSPQAVKLFDSVVDAQTLARVILMRKDYTGKPIRLLCCETGKMVDGTCFAKELSKLLGVDVLAPTEEFNVSTLGNIEIVSPEGKKGRMRTFKSK